MTSFTSHMTSGQNICVPRRDKTGVILRQTYLMENSREMTAVSQMVQEILMKMHEHYSVHYGIVSIGLYICGRLKFFSSGASVHISGLHLHVFLSPNLNFYACRSQNAQCCTFLSTKQTSYVCVEGMRSKFKS